MKYHALLVIFEKSANLKLLSAANYILVTLYGLSCIFRFAHLQWKSIKCSYSLFQIGTSSHV